MSPQIPRSGTGRRHLGPGASFAEPWAEEEIRDAGLSRGIKLAGAAPRLTTAGEVQGSFSSRDLALLFEEIRARRVRRTGHRARPC